ncbi:MULTISPECIES: surface-adhesin E family protein [unclassified Microcoleus]|uniref:surface-adhesin E family protein n=1 Tax=unclassified Microcoleus TaxID=2642155 RepID=UPI002FD6C6B5
MKTRFTEHKINNLSSFFLATWIFVSVNTLSARAEKLRCFVDICIDPEKLRCFAYICIDPSSVKLSKSDIPGVPYYPVRTILGTQQSSYQKMFVQMEFNCKQRQFRIVRAIKYGRNWSDFDPRWTLITPNSPFSRLVDYTCKLAIE